MAWYVASFKSTPRKKSLSSLAGACILWRSSVRSTWTGASIPCDPLYCNPPALGRDSAYIIIMHPLSIYAWSLMSATVHTLSEFTPGYLWPVWSAPHGLLSGWLSWQGPHIQSDWLFCWDSMHGGTPSGIQVLFTKWVPLGHHWPGLHHAALHTSGTWSGHPCITIHMRNLWKAVVHLQG